MHIFTDEFIRTEFYMKTFIILFLSCFSAGCLKAKKSPFDVSTPSGMGGLVLVSIKPASWNKVLSLSPVDGAKDVSASSSVSFTFQSKVQAATVTASLSGTSCTGSVQLSKDSFVTCIPFQVNPSSTDSLSFTAVPSSTLWSQTVYKLKITKDIKNSDGTQALETDYTSPSGFTVGFPCSNCVQTSTAPAGITFAGGSNNTLLSDGKTLIIGGGGSANTVIFDPERGNFSQGTSLTANGASGATSFLISGGVHSGKIMIMHGTLTSNSIYDPSNGTMSAGPVVTNGGTSGAANIPVTSGANAGKVFVVLVNVNATAIYNPSTNSFSAGSSTVVSTHCSAIGSGLNFIPQDNGSYNILCGGGSTAGSITFNPSTLSLTSTASASGNIGAGGCNILVSSGAYSGKYLVIHGNGTTGTSIFDPSALTFSAGPNLPANAGIGASLIPIKYGTNAGKILLIHGNTAATTSIFDPATGTFSAGITLQGTVATGGNSFNISSGIYNGAIAVIHGGITGNISIIFP